MRQLTIVAVALWLGALGTFAFVVAPAAFGALEREAAGRLVAAVLPRCQWAGAGLGLVAIVGVVARRRRGRRAVDRASLPLLVGMLGLTLYGLLVVLPEADALREVAIAARRGDGPSEASRRFTVVHRTATLMGLAVMVGGVAVIAVEASGGAGGRAPGAS